MDIKSATVEELTFQVILTFSCLTTSFLPLGPFEWNEAVTERASWVTGCDGHLVQMARIRCIETGEEF